MRRVGIFSRVALLCNGMHLIGVMAFVVLTTPWASAQRQTLPDKIIAYPDTVLYNGKILTADDQFTIVEAVAIRDGKFLEVGKNNAALELAGPRTRKIDLQGKTVTPGFIAHHLHLPDYAYYAMLMRRDDIQWEGEFYPGGDKLVWDRVEILLRDIKKAAAVAKPNEWVVIVAAFQAEPVIRQLRRSEMDAVSPNNPVVILTPVEGLVFAANSLALKMANLTPETSGYPYGDEAMVQGGDTSWRLSLASQWSIPTEKLANGLKKKIAEYNANGITMIGGTRIQPPELTAVRELWVRGELTMRWRVALQILNSDSNPESTLQHLGNLSDLGDDMFRISGMALGASDGAPFSGQAWTWEPKLRELPGFPNRPYGPRGLNDPWPEREKVSLIVRYGWSSANSHSAGDRGTSEYLSIYEEAKKNPIAKSSNQRLAIDHLVAVRPQDIKKFKELGIIPSISPWFLFKKEENELVVQQYGVERVHQWMPGKSYIDAGLRPTIEEDIDGLPYRGPLWNIEKMVTRKDDAGREWNPKEKVSREQGLWMMTNWTAYYVGDEKKLGTIEAGKLADLVVLDKDYLSVPEDEIHKMPIVMTMVGGKVVYEKPRN